MTELTIHCAQKLWKEDRLLAAVNRDDAEQVILTVLDGSTESVVYLDTEGQRQLFNWLGVQLLTHRSTP